MKKINLIVLFLVLAMIFGGCGKEVKNSVEIPDVTGKLNFTVLKAGQADAIIMQTQNRSIIIDCGEKDDGDEIAEYLQEENITNVDYMFITHFDKDHVGGFPEVMESVNWYRETLDDLMKEIKENPKDDTVSFLTEYCHILGLSLEEYFQLSIENMTFLTAKEVYTQRMFGGNSSAATEFLRAEFGKNK